MVSYKTGTYLRTCGPKCKGFRLPSWCKAFGGSEILPELLSGCLVGRVRPPAVLGGKTQSSQCDHLLGRAFPCEVDSIALDAQNMGPPSFIPDLVCKSRAPLLPT